MLYPYYWPLYKAGGPVQSLFNICAVFSAQCDFFLVTLNRDIDGELHKRSLELNTWSKGVNGEQIYFVEVISPLLILRIILEVNPDTIFINGIFNIRTTLPGLIWGKLLKKKVVISPRGMLQDWGLKRKKLLKKIFLVCLKLLVKRDEHWHATDENEAGDIKRIFGRQQQIHLASNIPRAISPYTDLAYPDPHGKIRLVFLSLINPNKNLHLVIDAVNGLSSKFRLDIFGPVIDKKYWEMCLSKISDPSTIRYKGPVPPWQVPDLLSGYHFFVLPTQGENFGHAIFDALASGVPVIISRNTPWHGIELKHAGFYLDLNNEHSLTEILKKLSDLGPEEYKQLRKGSILYAEQYWKNKNYESEYDFLFNHG